MKYRIKVKVEFEECGDDIDCGVEGPGQIVLSEEDACSIDEVEAALMSASYEVMRQENSRHFEAMSKKKPGPRGE
ncbi:hypothetical protein BVX99_02190 [bacterium F16]|nr:hypothetical protein BVX99_02190 [bacterium F16]